MFGVCVGIESTVCYHCDGVPALHRGIETGWMDGWFGENEVHADVSVKHVYSYRACRLK